METRETREWRFGVVANIKKEHYDENGILRYGSKAFSGGAKVYLYGRYWDETCGMVGALGINRFKRRVFEHVPICLLENVRCQRVYKPSMLESMEYYEWFEGYDWWKRSVEDRKATKDFCKRLVKQIEIMNCTQDEIRKNKEN